MAGLDREGFTPLTYNELVTRISDKLEVFSPGMDLSPESPDGQQVLITAFELSQVWNELNLVYNTYNPNVASGAGLRNIGLITGLPYGAATRSQAVIELVGTTGVTVPKGSIVTDAIGNEFSTVIDAVIPASVEVIAILSGEIVITAGTLIEIKTPVTGWDSFTQNTNGITGTLPQTEVAYRNLRNRTVLRNYVTVEETMTARLLENLGIEQVSIVNNDQSIAVDGVPAQTIHVTVGEVGNTSDMDIALIILATKGLGCPTHGSTQVIDVPDVNGELHIINFSKATAQEVFINVTVTFLDEDKAGALENISADLVTHVNSLLTDEDVVWSRLFGIITPYSKAQVDLLELSTDGITYTPVNINVAADRFASTTAGQISVTETP